MNKLGLAAGMALAEVLKGNTALTSLRSAALPSNPPARASGPHGMHAPYTRPFHLPFPFAQPLRQQPRPRGWHGARRGAQGQHDPHVAQVCCSAILNPLAHALRPHSIHARCSRPFHLPFPFAQPPPQQPRPRGRHGVRRGAQGQHDPHEAHVCCPAIEPTRPCVQGP
eukprot:scaffold9967_cov64-Phaeocystis_antarctica.AAC.1